MFFALAVCQLMGLWAQQNDLEKACRSANADSALQCLQQHAGQAASAGDTVTLLEATCLMARKLTQKSLYTKAAKLVEPCLAYPFVKKNALCEGKLYLELGAINRYEGSYAQSLTYYLQAKKIFEQLPDWKYLAYCKTHLAEYYRKLGKYDLASRYISNVLREYGQHNLTDTALLIYIHNRAAAIANESNPDMRVTIDHTRKALSLAIQSGDKDAEATSLNELGFTYKNLRKNDSAEILYKQAEEIWFSIGANREALNAMNNRAMLYSHNEYAKHSIVALYEKLIDMVLKKNIDYPLNEAYGYLYSQYAREGDSGKAFKYFDLYHKSTVQKITRQSDIQITNITEKYESEKAKREIKRITGVLTESRAEIAQKKSENRTIYFFISILAVLLIVVGLLLLRINQAKTKLAYRNIEKDALIQEIHHRVKNNLQFISSLINMQLNSSVDEKEIHTLNDASRRIRAMALVHEMLYNHKESSGISIKQYLEELVLSLDHLVNSDKISIAFRLDVQDENFNVSDSIALGMIASELVSNSMKHAFQDVEKPEIRVKLEKDQSNVLFMVSDNGTGIKDEQKRKKSLGLRLIDIFSRQLKGKYTITSRHGYQYELQFKAR